MLAHSQLLHYEQPNAKQSNHHSPLHLGQHQLLSIISSMQLSHCKLQNAKVSNLSRTHPYLLERSDHCLRAVALSVLQRFHFRKHSAATFSSNSHQLLNAHSFPMAQPLTPSIISKFSQKSDSNFPILPLLLQVLASILYPMTKACL